MPLHLLTYLLTLDVEVDRWLVWSDPFLYWLCGMHIGQVNNTDVPRYVCGIDYCNAVLAGRR